MLSLIDVIYNFIHLVVSTRCLMGKQFYANFPQPWKYQSSYLSVAVNLRRRIHFQCIFETFGRKLVQLINYNWQNINRIHYSLENTINSTRAIGADICTPR